MSVQSGEKDYLSIKSCEVDSSTGKVSVDGKKQFIASINPTNFDDSATIDYNHDKTFGQPAPIPRFGGVGPRKVSFDIMLDGTGVFQTCNFDSDPPSVKDQITSLKELVSEYDGSKHSPNVVQIVWGTFLLYGCLEDMKENITLLKASGEPLRATIKLSFTEYKTPQEASKEANMSSPDLTHVVEVVAGDTLLMLCNRFYKDSSYYLQVARYNGLTTFRNLTPGMKLKFPPLR
ncbi:MAG: hypothetical protein MI922_21270 [Bacteroidales bacterium]|nr:hypothetical protein [Bacteroidales bacterium]